MQPLYKIALSRKVGLFIYLEFLYKITIYKMNKMQLLYIDIEDIVSINSKVYNKLCKRFQYFAKKN